METREQYGISSLDLLKLICAVLVVGIHTEPFQSIRILDMGFGVLTRCAVPIFFAISGYLFFSRKTKLSSFLKKNGIMYLFWVGVYRIVDILKAQSAESFSLAKIVRIFAGGGYSTLWFFQSLMVAVIIVYTLDRLLKNKNCVFCITLCLYVLGVLLSTYYDIAQKVRLISVLHDSRFIQFIGTRNGLFYAPVFVSLGLMLAPLKNDAKVEKFSVQKGFKQNMTYRSALIIVLCFAALAVESAIAMMVIKVSSTILWLMVVPWFILFFGLQSE